MNRLAYSYLQNCSTARLFTPRGHFSILSCPIRMGKTRLPGTTLSPVLAFLRGKLPRWRLPAHNAPMLKFRRFFALQNSLFLDLIRSSRGPWNPCRNRDHRPFRAKLQRIAACFQARFFSFSPARRWKNRSALPRNRRKEARDWNPPSQAAPILPEQSASGRDSSRCFFLGSGPSIPSEQWSEGFLPW